MALTMTDKWPGRRKTQEYLARRDEAHVEGVDDELGGRLDVEFADDVFAVGVDGVGTEAEGIGDALGGIAGGDEFEDFALAGGDALVDDAGIGGVLVEDDVEDFVAEELLAARGGLHGHEEFVVGGAAGNIAFDAAVDDVEDVLHIIVVGHDEDVLGRETAEYLGDYFGRPGADGVIEDEKVGRVGGEGLLPGRIVRLHGHAEVVALRKYVYEPGHHQGLPLSDQNVSRQWQGYVVYACNSIGYLELFQIEVIFAVQAAMACSEND